MIFVIATNWDGETVTQFEDKGRAEKYCTEFLKKNSCYGGDVKAFEGRQLEVKTVSVVDKIELQ